jgi:N-acetylglucosamine kinase-like BadF-type ATPase
MLEYVIGVDGGNSKTDVVVASTTGQVLARTRGPGVESPLGRAVAWRDQIIALVDESRRAAGIDPQHRARCAVFYLANVDLPVERRIARRELERVTPAEVTIVQNDTFAVLRAGASRPWGVGVVAGFGINAVGVHPSGRVARFLAFGDFTGDSGGGHHIGVGGMAAAMRARDGRGPATVLTTLVPRHYGLRHPEDVAIAVRRGAIAHADLHALAPVTFAAAAEGDPVAREILSAFADEVAIMALALIRRLHLTRTDVEVVLGGGTLQSGDLQLTEQVTANITERVPRAQVRVLDGAPVLGALVEALDRSDADHSSVTRLRTTLATAM